MRPQREETFRVRGLRPDELAGLGELVPDAWMPERAVGPEEPVPSLDGWSWGGSSRVADFQLDADDL